MFKNGADDDTDDSPDGGLGVSAGDGAGNDTGCVAGDIVWGGACYTPSGGCFVTNVAYLGDLFAGRTELEAQNMTRTEQRSPATISITVTNV